ncbi:TIGR03936 family radical SAM-associated protein [uncultured Clostridium sp.]|uniref:TIGR03936 family radical SAM-associated protein n=1 Tax=uncultured Clostridium sp. TaxID=59620 RepID=UPI002621292E|nr:TIGR03936 family radical SAM-associated protein [uncultured Clostridium sp.]
MRYLIKFTKGEGLKFISHLDLLRTVQKIGRRAELPVEYSEGFNPHMAFVIALPLSVGVYSDGDYADLYLHEDLECDYVLEKLNENSARDIKFLEASKSPVIMDVRRLPPAMALLDAATYITKIRYEDTKDIDEDMRLLDEMLEYNTMKKTKRSEKLTDIKPFIKEFSYRIEDKTLVIDTLICCGSRETLSPSLLADFVRKNTRNAVEDAFIDIKRTEMLGYKDEVLVPLYKYIE